MRSVGFRSRVAAIPSNPLSAGYGASVFRNGSFDMGEYEIRIEQGFGVVLLGYGEKQHQTIVAMAQVYSMFAQAITNHDNGRTSLNISA